MVNFADRPGESQGVALQHIKGQALFWNLKSFRNLLFVMALSHKWREGNGITPA
ncbi:hypothetical protein [Paracoccus subflavus]|uniref:hypothetical protein n=1 Tax=Paracoccus subflavus TaxID=2528244 RepID=UPI0013EF3CEA|nr:hypothetical protein [Paracoccus subflavus]